jgi:hypothetical protein
MFRCCLRVKVGGIGEIAGISGHASVVTTELYLGVKQNLHDAACDRLGIIPISDESDAI